MSHDNVTLRNRLTEKIGKQVDVRPAVPVPTRSGWWTGRLTEVGNDYLVLTTEVDDTPNGAKTFETVIPLSSVVGVRSEVGA